MTEGKIATAIISLGTGDDPQNLRRCLESIAPFTDGVFVTLTGPRDQIAEAEKVCHDFNAKISYYQERWKATDEAVAWLTEYLGYPPHLQVNDELFVFNEARNFNFSQIPKEYDWIFWIDTDDVLVDGENLWKLKEIGKQANIEAFYMKYIYWARFDKKGKVTEVLLEHVRERMVRNSGVFSWVAPIHESLVQSQPTTKTTIDDCHVLHITNPDHIQKAITRNLKNLELALYQTRGEDPRYIYYLAKGYVDLKTAEYNDRAIPLIQSFLWGEFQSEWPDERAQAYEYLADIYIKKGLFNKAIKSCLRALSEEPARLSIYLLIAQAYIAKEDWDKALAWIAIADKVVEKETTLTVTPQDTKTMRLSTLYAAYMQKGKTNDAYEAIKKLKALLPSDPSVQECFEFMRQQKEQRDVATTISDLIDYLKVTKEYEKILALLANVPDVAKSDPLIEQIRDKYLIPQI